MSLQPNKSDQRATGETAIAPRRPWPPLRILVILLAGAEACFLILYIGVMATLALSSDALGSAIGQGVMLLAAAPFVLFVLPALVLGVMNRRLPLAFVLALLAILLAVVLFYNA
jgi:hypothetical protein